MCEKNCQSLKCPSCHIMVCLPVYSSTDTEKQINHPNTCDILQVCQFSMDAVTKYYKFNVKDTKRPKSGIRWTHFLRWLLVFLDKLGVCILVAIFCIISVTWLFFACVSS